MPVAIHIQIACYMGKNRLHVWKLLFFFLLSIKSTLDIYSDSKVGLTENKLTGISTIIIASTRNLKISLLSLESQASEWDVGKWKVSLMVPLPRTSESDAP